MASRKGGILTIAILAAITAASFAFWFVPMNQEMTLVVADHRELLDGVDSIRQAVQISLESSYAAMLNGTLEPVEFVSEAEVATDQMIEQISILISSQPPPQWTQSYAEYVEALRAFNSMAREMIVVASALESGDQYQNSAERIEELAGMIQDSISASDLVRP